MKPSQELKPQPLGVNFPRVLPQSICFSKIANNDLDPEALPLIFTRGKADISLLKQLLASKGDSVWAEEVRACFRC